MDKHIFLSNPLFFCLLSKLRNLLCFICLLNQSLSAGWHDRKAEGWAWYEEKKQLEKEEAKREEPLHSTEQLDQVRKNLEEKLAAALLEPTPANIKTYMEEQQKWVERSSHFAQVWTQTLLNYPHLDYTATNLPVSQYGLQVYKQNLQEEKEQLIASLVKEYGLFFFYEGKSEASSIFGRIVEALSQKYGWKIVAISIDGIEIQGFTSAKKNNGIVENLGIDVVPALYLIHPITNVAVPISFGLVALDQIENNIALQFKAALPHE